MADREQKGVFYLLPICLAIFLIACNFITSALEGKPSPIQTEQLADQQTMVAPADLLQTEAPSSEEPTEPAQQAPAETRPIPTRAPVSQVSGDCQPEYDFVTDLSVYETPTTDEPLPRAWFRDPVFGTCLIRVTDRAHDLDPEDPSEGMKNEYSRVQSFNADNSYLIVRSTDGNWYLYDAHTLQPVRRLPVDIDPRWDATDPDLIYSPSGTQLISYRISTGETSLVHDFAADFPGQNLAAVWTRYEGSPSLDGRYWGLMAENQDWLTVALLVYDQVTDRVIAVREVDPQVGEIDSVTISPSGKYFLAYFDNSCEPGHLGDENNPCGLMVYDQNLQHGRALLRLVGHSDPAFDTQGREVLVYGDIDTDNVALLDLESGQITNLFSIDFSYSPIGMHFSGRASQVPGWILISTYAGAQPSATWMDDMVFAVELKENGRIVRLAHTYAITDLDMEKDYLAEPQASTNQDFTQVLFTSNWGRSGTGQVEMYMIELPERWWEHLPQK